MRKILASPAPYAGWAILVVASLTATYFAHPYIFGFTTVGLAWLTGVVVLVGFASCVLSPTPTATRMVIFGCLFVAAAAIATALAVLQTFNWA